MPAVTGLLPENDSMQLLPLPLPAQRQLKLKLKWQLQ